MEPGAWAGELDGCAMETPACMRLQEEDTGGKGKKQEDGEEGRRGSTRVEGPAGMDQTLATVKSGRERTTQEFAGKS